MDSISSIVEVKNLTVEKQGKKIISSLNFKVKKGEILYIIGPNGGGKTTLIKSIVGIEKFKGEVKIFGKPLGKAKKEMNLIGYVPQAKNFEQNFPITGEEAITFFGTYEGKEAMERFGVYEIKDKKISELSGGQLQRVFLARAFVNDPELIIMDEPDTALDAKWRETLYKEIEKENKKGKTIIMATHDLTVMKSKKSKVLCINKSMHIHGGKEIITKENLEKIYGCPVEFIAHGEVPHRVLEMHKDD